jgi:hypothetical protein
MMLLKHVMVRVSDPREGAQDGNDNEDVGDDATNENSRVLHSAIPNDIDDLEDQPTAVISRHLHVEWRVLTQHLKAHSQNGCLPHVEV